MAIIWRVLVVDDKQADEVKSLIEGDAVLGEDNLIEVETCKTFNQAKTCLRKLQIDLIVLDLRDDSIEMEDADTELPGERVFKQIKKNFFLPVIFHTAYAERVGSLRSSFVKVVTRGSNPTKLRNAIKEIFQTKVLQLLRHLEDEKREHMWERILKNEANFLNQDPTDLSYSLARRLANVLESSSIKRFLAGAEATGAHEELEIHPIEMYIYPSVHPELLACDILKLGRTYWIVLTPSCDIVLKKATTLLLAKCFKIEDQAEHKKISAKIQTGAQPSKNEKMSMLNLIGNNRQMEGEKFQPERYAFLPKTFFIPDLVVDFQHLERKSLKQLPITKRIASLESPYSESLISRFTRYFGRLGTPNLDKEIAYKRMFG